MPGSQVDLYINNQGYTRKQGYPWPVIPALEVGTEEQVLSARHSDSVLHESNVIHIGDTFVTVWNEGHLLGFDIDDVVFDDPGVDPFAGMSDERKWQEMEKILSGR